MSAFTATPRMPAAPGRLDAPALALWALSMALAGAVFGLLLLGVGRGVLIPGGAMGSDERSISHIDSAKLIARTVLIAGGIGAGAVLLGAPAAWALRRLPAAAAPLLALPMLMPSYLVHAAASLLRAPGTWLGDRLEGGSAAQWVMVNHAQAIGSLALWSWQLAAAVLAPACRAVERESIDALALAGAGPFRRAAMVARSLGAPALAAAGLVAMVMLGSAVPLHLAQVETCSIVVWREFAESGASPGAWRGALPLIVAAVLVGGFLGARLARHAGPVTPGAHGDPAVGRGWVAAALVLWIVSLLGPPSLFAANLRSPSLLGSFVRINAEAMTNSIVAGAVAGALGGVVLLGSWAGFGAPPRGVVRAVTRFVLGLWLIGALIPGVLVGAAMSAAGALPALRAFTDSGAALVAAHLVRFGALAALTGLWLRRTEPRALADARALYAGASGMRGLAAGASLHLGPVAAAILGMAFLSFHEIEAAVMVAPAGAPTFPQRMLALLHYLRDDELSAGVVVVTLGAIGLAALAAGLATMRGRAAIGRAASVLVLAVVVAGAGACRETADAPEPAPLRKPVRVLGSLGRGGGQFIYPRCIDADEESIWIIDKAARVQRLAPGGEPRAEFIMPAHEKGMPTGVTIGPDGLLYVADTHEHRVAVFDSRAMSGEILRQWGEYGYGQGQFVFPTDVAILPGADGRTPERFFVSEYGGNDRVSAFDGTATFLFAIGAPGLASESAGVVFSRPQSVLLDAAHSRLIVADAANHRLGVFTLDGELVKWIGRAGGAPGRAAGEFCYPYGLALLQDGTLLVSEFGNNRVQLVDIDSGRGIGIIGAAGRAEGQLVTPWGVAAIGERILVLDSGNNRVQEYRRP